tara:strand:- start:222 stop:518 length:297 start_codon:yes stop_codon:yes gene_type:complete
LHDARIRANEQRSVFSDRLGFTDVRSVGAVHRVFAATVSDGQQRHFERQMCMIKLYGTVATSEAGEQLRNGDASAVSVFTLHRCEENVDVFGHYAARR